MSFSRIVSFLVIVAILIFGARAAYNFLDNLKITRPVNLPSQLLAGTSTDGTSATSTASVASTTVDIGQFYKVATSSWKTFASDELGYSVKYPAGLKIKQQGAVITLTFPVEKYFHWPLNDDVLLTISATGTCPTMTAQENSPSSMSFMLNGYGFVSHEGHGVAAGNLYNEWAYETRANNVCYSLDLFDHGANGAGLYVSDQSLINQYNKQHDSDLETVINIFKGIVGTYRLRSTPAGRPEDTRISQ